ncbi:uncharacterized protein LOC8289113 [Ricinus communis]|uniref:Uncharacterized protein n=1 Tax=Ricinus communis TaxID=3988 RepID=B9SNX5_RICCO|nr:uncharacterized protein LOC8289113 [Ricinus communis]EEF34693.1 conserved hypothetical protein [Ricinus communis]|eukprot:XP_002527694.1 uncharacterized protein LOC8289113 [Ricinus communis]
MKLLLLVIFYLLATSLYFFSHNISSVPSPSAMVLTGRRSLRERRMLPLDHGIGHHKDKVLDENRKQMTFQEHFREQEHDSRNDLEIVYLIDYNGVTTHPVPTPKHPRP